MDSDVNSQSQAGDLEPIADVIRRLLAPGGCPWDQEQSPVSLCDYLIEESFELVEAIRSGDSREIEEELGDVFFLLLFLTHLFQQAGVTDLQQVAGYNASKMIRRHPHVFSDTEISSKDELLRNWERIKRGEKADSEKKGVFSSLPASLPPLLRAYRIHSKASRFGFTWENDADLDRHCQAEWQEWKQARENADPQAMQDEFGDYLFSLVEMGRRCGIKANAALHAANAKFLRRFSAMEEMATSRGENLSELSLSQMNTLWEEVKKAE